MLQKIGKWLASAAAGDLETVRQLMSSDLS
jgi:hypothetical protein